MSELPETVLQFGGGKFLRAFADLFIHHANLGGQKVGQVVVVQSTDSERARLLNAQGGRYQVAVRGLWQGELVDRVEGCASIRRALLAQTDWPAVRGAACGPEIRYVLSNTTEAGLVLNPDDTPDDAPPRSFPAKLLCLLQERYRRRLPGVTLLPCELIEDNATVLRSLLLEQAQRWNLASDFQEWLVEANDWRNTLVDRIVTGKPKDHPPTEADPLAITAEPFAFWAVEGNARSSPLFTHPAILETADITPYFLRKVRILNATHTAMVHLAMRRGIPTVREALQNAEIAAWLHGLLEEEILPTVGDRVEDAEGFAQQTLERFANPFLEHKISDIAVYHEAKARVRLLPTYQEYQAKFGKTPPHLAEAIAALSTYPPSPPP